MALITAERSWAEHDRFWAEFPSRVSEDRVPPCALPDPLTCFDGRKIASKEEWLKFRRPELLRFYQEKLYGFAPPKPEIRRSVLTREKPDALGGIAVRREISITLAMNSGRSVSFPVLLYLPQGRPGPYPVILTQNFYGNHTATAEPDIPVADHWLPNQWRERFATLEMRARYRGSQELSERAWQDGATEALKRGYAVATFCYECMMPDNGYHFEHSIYQLFHGELDYMSEKRDFGSIGAWAWGISRVIDCFETIPELDCGRIVVLGHSRLGKTALWAAVQDERIALAIANDSGCCCAKLFHRDFGENLRFMAYWRPFWFSLGIQEYADREMDLPVDQHELIGMIAPRLVYVASASEDLGADPKGEFLAAWHAGRIYELFGLKGLPGPAEFPAPGAVFHDGAIGYHLRPGKHALTFWDWQRYLDYADRHLRGME